jgi:hypothetical protein
VAGFERSRVDHNQQFGLVEALSDLVLEAHSELQSRVDEHVRKGPKSRSNGFEGCDRNLLVLFRVADENTQNVRFPFWNKPYLAQGRHKNASAMATANVVALLTLCAYLHGL